MKSNINDWYPLLIFSSVHCQEFPWRDKRKHQVVGCIDLLLKSPNHHIRNKWQSERRIDILSLAMAILRRKVITVQILQERFFGNINLKHLFVQCSWLLKLPIFFTTWNIGKMITVNFFEFQKQYMTENWVYVKSAYVLIYSKGFCFLLEWSVSKGPGQEFSRYLIWCWAEKIWQKIFDIIIHQTHYEKSVWSRAFNQFTIACELDMINAISAADIAFIMSSSQAIVNWLNALDQTDFS